MATMSNCASQAKLLRLPSYFTFRWRRCHFPAPALIVTDFSNMRLQYKRSLLEPSPTLQTERARRQTVFLQFSVLKDQVSGQMNATVGDPFLRFFNGFLAFYALFSAPLWEHTTWRRRLSKRIQVSNFLLSLKLLIGSFLHYIPVCQIVYV